MLQLQYVGKKSIFGQINVTAADNDDFPLNLSASSLDIDGMMNVTAILDDKHRRVLVFNQTNASTLFAILFNPSNLTNTSIIRFSPSIITYDQNSSKYIVDVGIEYVNEVKTGPFFEHSSTLFDVSNVAHWSKVNQGMVKMYHGEVLDKFPIAQHILFGNLVSFDPVPKSSGDGIFKKPASVIQKPKQDDDSNAQ